MVTREIQRDGLPGLEVITNMATYTIGQTEERDCTMIYVQRGNLEPTYQGCAHRGTYSPQEHMRQLALELEAQRN